MEVPFTVVLGFMFVQGIVAAVIPKSNKTPRLAWYVLSSIFLAIITVLLGLVCSIVHNIPGAPGLRTGRLVVDWLGFLVQPSRWLCCCTFCKRKLKRNGLVKRESIAPIVDQQRVDSDSTIARSHSSLEAAELQNRSDPVQSTENIRTTVIDEAAVEAINLQLGALSPGTSETSLNGQAPPYETLSPPSEAAYENMNLRCSVGQANSIDKNEEPKMIAALASPLPYSEAVGRPASRGSSGVTAWAGEEGTNGGLNGKSKTPYTWEEVANVLNRMFGVFYVLAALGLFFGLLFPILLPTSSTSA